MSAEQRALQASIRDWAQQAGTLALVRTLEPGTERGTPPSEAPWAGHWAALADLGVFSIALPEPAGGAGGTVALLGSPLEPPALAAADEPGLAALLARVGLRGYPGRPVGWERRPPPTR